MNTKNILMVWWLNVGLLLSANVVAQHHCPSGDKLGLVQGNQGTYVRIMVATQTNSIGWAKDKLTSLNYAMCTLAKGRYSLVYAGPFSSPEAAKQAMLVLQSSYADAYLEQPDGTCESSMAAPSCPPAIVPNLSDANSNMTGEDQQELLLWRLKGVGNWRSELMALADLVGYSRTIFDLQHSDDGFNSFIPVLQKASFSTNINDIQLVVATLQKGSELNTYVYEIDDPSSVGEKLFYVTDVAVENESLLKVYDVQAGSLMDNAKGLATTLGWQVPSNGWQLSNDYIVKYPYSFVYSDEFDAFSHLFDRYPIQAQLMTSHKQVVFASRPLPLNR